MEKENYNYFEKSYARGSDIWSHIPIISVLLKFLPKQENLMCLDIGCGMSNVPQALIRKGFFCIGIDYIPHVIQEQKKQIKKEGLEKKGRFLCLDINNIPFTKESFDFISDIQSFQYLNMSNWENYQNELCKILKKDGFYLNVSLSKKSKKIYGHEPRKSSENYFTQFGIKHYFFTKQSIENIFKKNFTLVRQEEHVYPSLSDPKDSITLLFTLMKKKHD